MTDKPAKMDWKKYSMELETEVKQLKAALALAREAVAHVLRCIPINGFAQIHYGSATAADLDEALAATEEKK